MRPPWVFRPRGVDTNEKAVLSKGKEDGANAEIEVTNCPECGTEWEVVVTERRRSQRPEERIQV